MQAEIDDPVLRYLQQLLDEATTTRVSDIHFEALQSEYRIRYRRLGNLLEYDRVPTQTANRIIAHLKVICQLDPTERRLPQDGSNISLNSQTAFRFSAIPTIFGEKVVLRLMQTQDSLITIQQLGMTDSQQDRLIANLHKPCGMILICGATGCGKTTTLYAAMDYLSKNRQKNIVSVENPVEIFLEGTNQVSVHPNIGFDFNTALRSILRQDPDVIVIGEIRDELTAKTATQAALTGHLVLATLHSSNPTTTRQRLQSLKIQSADLSNSLNLIVAQSLHHQNEALTPTVTFEFYSPDTAS